MKIKDLEFKPFIKEEEIQKKVRKIARLINKDFEGKNPLFLVILNGAFVFAADLFREIKIPAEISFIKISTYEQITSSGKVKELIGLNENVFNRHLIIVEDIIESGLTLEHAMAALEDLGSASIHIVSLFVKPKVLEHKLDIKYPGFKIPPEFIVGYGLDYDGYGRNLKDVYIKAK
jgi:hypoxanthine phosphoribosyltransferase